MPASPTKERSSLFDDLKAALRIDENDLDTAFIQQPDLNQRVGEEYNSCKSILAEIKFDIMQLEASLGAQYRAEAEQASSKLTVDDLKRQIASAPKMITLQKELLRAEEKLGNWGTLRESYSQRLSALKGLVELYGLNYFSINAGVRQRNQAVEHQANSVRGQAGEERRNRIPRERPSSND